MPEEQQRENEEPGLPAIRRAQQALIEQLKSNRSLTDPRLEQALLDVPRHLFLPGFELQQIYQDIPIVTRESDGRPSSSCSQPAVVTRMLEMLDLAPGEKVLEIGAGTGWAAALMGRLVLPGGVVTTLDITEEVAAGARENLARSGSTNVRVVTRDGGAGHEPGAPYDALIATVGIWDITPAWLEQLRVGGRMVLPFWLNTLQFGLRFNKVDDSNLVMTAHCGTLGFMRFRGPFAGLESYYYQDDYRIDSEITEPEQLEELIGLVSGGARYVPFPLAVERWHRMELMDFLAVSQKPVIGLMDWKNRHGFSFGCGLVAKGSLVILPTHPAGAELPREIAVFGGDAALTELTSLAQRWIAQGRPGLGSLQLSARPLEAPSVESRPGDGAAEGVFRKHWMQYHASFAATS